MMLGAWLLGHDVGCMAGCVMAFSGWRSTFTPTGEHAVSGVWLLRLRVRCLVEVLFKRVPPLRAFGPPVGMTVKGGACKSVGWHGHTCVAMG